MKSFWFLRQRDFDYNLANKLFFINYITGNVENTDTEHYDNMRKTIDMKLQAAFPMRQKEDHKTTTMERLQQVKAASTIQRHFRNWKTRSLAQHRSSIDIGVTDDKFLRVGNPADERQHKSSIQRLFTDNKLTRTLSSLSIRSPFSRKRMDSSSSPESKTKAPMTRSYSAYSGRKINSRPIMLSSPSKTRSILRSSDSGGSPSSGKLSQHTMNSSSAASSRRRGHQRRKKAHHQVSFFEPNIAGIMLGGADTSSTTRTTISKASSIVDEDHLDGIIQHHQGDDDLFYSDDDHSDSDSDTENVNNKDDKCDCKDCLDQENIPAQERSNILIAPYKKQTVEKALSSDAGSSGGGRSNSSSRRNSGPFVNNRSRVHSSSPVQKNQANVIKTHQLTDSALSLKEMPNVRL